MKRILIILIAMFPFFSCGKKAALPYETDKIAAPGGGEVEIVFIKHGSLALNYKDFHIQIDPVSKQDGMTVDYSKFPKADLILVTHDHFDHLDPDAVKTFKEEIPFFGIGGQKFRVVGVRKVQSDSCRFLKRRRRTDSQET